MVVPLVAAPVAGARRRLWLDVCPQSVPWFAVDGIGSILAGALLNVVGNPPFLVIAAWTASAGAEAQVRSEAGAS
jgi:hypothetical protein